MTRLYFDTKLDPTGALKVIYMAVEFGVIFEVETVIYDGKNHSNHKDFKLYPASMRGDVRGDALVDNPNRRSNKYQMYYANYLFRFGKLYVAPESEHIFKPKEGDIGLNLRSDGIAIAIDDEDFELKRGSIDPARFYKIIMRDNKHFFTPENETI